MSKTKIGWASDIHLDHVRGNKTGLHEQVEAAGLDALFLTGDLSNGKMLSQHLLDMAGDFNIPIYFVLGNHDFYDSSLAQVREDIAQLSENIDCLNWLPTAGVVPLVGGSCVVGVDGWYDGRYGMAEEPVVIMNDWRVIEELRHMTDHKTLLSGLREIADQEADAAYTLLSDAVAQGFKKVFFLTHVPPWREAAWHMMNHSEDGWAPWFTSKATGDVLEDIATNNPGVSFEVLTGHVHSRGVYQVLPNLSCRTAGAEYGDPKLEDIFFLKDLD